MCSNSKSCFQQQAHNCVCPKQEKATEAVSPEIIHYLSKIIWAFIVNLFSNVKSFSAIPLLGKIRKWMQYSSEKFLNVSNFEEYKTMYCKCFLIKYSDKAYVIAEHVAFFFFFFERKKYWKIKKKFRGGSDILLLRLRHNFNDFNHVINHKILYSSN